MPPPCPPPLHLEMPSPRFGLSLAQRTALHFCLVYVLFLALLISFTGPTSVFSSVKPHADGRGLRGDDANNGGRLLRFHVCNGLANQQLAVTHAAALAAQAGYTLELPELLNNGRQDLTTSVAPILPSEDSRLPFAFVYDEAHFAESLSFAGVDVVPASRVGTSLELPAARTEIGVVLRELAAAPAGSVVDIGCGLGAAHPELLHRHARVALAALDGLQPSSHFTDTVDRARAALAPAGQPYDAVHLRVESDWAGLCYFWRARPHSPDSKFCGDDITPEEMVARLEAAGVGGRRNASHPVFVAVDADALDARGAAVLAAVRAHFKVKTRADLLPRDFALPRELGALVDFHISMGAQTWVGNSYSTFSGLLILQRWRLGMTALWYNAPGRIVLDDGFPLFYTRDMARSAEAYVAPSGAPSWNPSNAPSSSWAPSYDPSFAPSNSYAPSFQPSYAPSWTPSYAPSWAPSYAPSFAPSYTPSWAPSYAPSFAPSYSNSYAPSFRPSSSYAPSSTPSSSRNSVSSSLSATVSATTGTSPVPPAGNAAAAATPEWHTYAIVAASSIFVIAFVAVVGWVTMRFVSMRAAKNRRATNVPDHNPMFRANGYDTTLRNPLLSAS